MKILRCGWTGSFNRQTVHRQLGSHFVTLNKSGGWPAENKEKVTAMTTKAESGLYLIFLHLITSD